MTDTSAPAAIALDASSRRVQIAVLWALGILALASFTVAYPGLAWVGTELAHLPAAVAYLLPLVIDAGLLVLGLAAAVKRSQRRSARLEFVGLIGLVGVSVVSQIAHVAALTETVSALTAVGGLIAAAAPLTLLLAVESALRAVLAEPSKRGRRNAPVAKTAPTAKATRTPPANRPVKLAPVAAETEPLTEGQRTKAVGRFESIPGYREVLERHVRTGTPTQREIHALEGTPSRATIGADARVVAAELTTLARAA